MTKHFNPIKGYSRLPRVHSVGLKQEKSAEENRKITQSRIQFYVITLFFHIPHKMRIVYSLEPGVDHINV